MGQRQRKKPVAVGKPALHGQPGRPEVGFDARARELGADLRPQVLAGRELDPQTESRDESPEQLLLRSEHREYLEDGLRLLTARERAALILRDVEGCSAEEVALQLDCSKATVRSHIANARIKLRRYMAGRRR